MYQLSGISTSSLYSPVSFKENEYVARSIENYDDIVQALRLRHAVFAEKLGWVATRPDGLEYDAYDAYSAHFGVFKDGEIVAYLRMIMPGNTFMIEKEFIDLVSDDHEIRKELNVSEMSRLCISEAALKSMRSENFARNSLQMILHKCVYHWCSANGVRFMYLVVEKRVYRMMRICGFYSTPVGESKIMPDGVEALAALLDIRMFDELSMARNPKVYDWFTTIQQDQDEVLSQQPAAYSQHQACA
ncbi:hypothetical protein JCM15519_01360 [Fundidesulfovibrio butyratiphilus]